MGRFDYIKYDVDALNTQVLFKTKFEELESLVDNLLHSPRAKALVMTKLEETYMWVGKAIRDDQVVRHGNASLQEERGDL